MILRSISLGCFALALIASSRAEEFVDLIDPMIGAITESGGHGGHGLGKTIPGEEGSDLIARTDLDHPNSPRQKYALTKAWSERIRRVAPL